LLLLLAACSQAIDNGADPPQMGAAFGRDTADPVTDAGAGEVFVAVVTGREGYNAPEALPSGSFLVEDRCLIFRYAGGRGLRRTPLLPPGSRLTGNLVQIGGAAVPLGQQVTLAGGDLPPSVVKSAIPSRCPQEVLLVTEVANS
jgi:hypothetical protein